MRTEQLSRDQLEALFNQLGPIVRYLGRLEDRMFQLAFDDDDEFYALVRQAHKAAHDARMVAHYAGCPNIGKRQEPMRGKGKAPLKFEPE